jgi:hypothetical protein
MTMWPTGPIQAVFEPFGPQLPGKIDLGGTRPR